MQAREFQSVSIFSRIYEVKIQSWSKDGGEVRSMNGGGRRWKVGHVVNGDPRLLQKCYVQDCFIEKHCCITQVRLKAVTSRLQMYNGPNSTEVYFMFVYQHEAGSQGGGVTPFHAVHWDTCRRSLCHLQHLASKAARSFFFQSEWNPLLLKHSCETSNSLPVSGQ